MSAIRITEGTTTKTAATMRGLSRSRRNTHEVQRAGVAIGLTPREFALLECFMRRPNRVLSRTIIEELVWDYDTEPLTNVVDVYVRRLRRKVDEGHEPRLLHTVRGTGYMMRE